MVEVGIGHHPQAPLPLQSRSDHYFYVGVLIAVHMKIEKNEGHIT